VVPLIERLPRIVIDASIPVPATAIPDLRQAVIEKVLSATTTAWGQLPQLLHVTGPHRPLDHVTHAGPLQSRADGG